MRRSAATILDRMGMLEPARKIWWRIHARGIGSWTPLVPEDSFQDCVQRSARHLLNHVPPDQFGDYLEFGVSRGNSLACAYHALANLGLDQVRLVGFDSFEGMPPESAEEGWPEGVYHSTLGATEKFLDNKGVDLDQVTLVKGWFRDTLSEATRQDHELNKASLIMVDCDIYSASAEALRFSEPQIGDHAVIMFDDWGWREEKSERGQKEAFEEFLDANDGISAEPLPAYRPEARVFHLARQ